MKTCFAKIAFELDSQTCCFTPDMEHVILKVYILFFSTIFKRDIL